MKFGLFKSPIDPKDFLMESFLDPVIVLPESYDIFNKMPPIKSQGQEGACAGFAGTCVKEYQEMINHGKYIELSPRFIYDLAKEKSGHKEGTTLKAIVEVLKEHGICTEKLCPYIPNDPPEITPKMYDGAEKYQIKHYARIKNLKELKQSIFQKYPEGGAILTGVSVYKGFISDESKETGAVPNPSCWDALRPLGGHAVTSYGWNDNSPYFKNDGHIVCQGSYGESFGDKGSHYFSYAYIKNHMLDCMCMIDVKNATHAKRVVDMSPIERNTAWV